MCTTTKTVRRFACTRKMTNAMYSLLVLLLCNVLCIVTASNCPNGCGHAKGWGVCSPSEQTSVLKVHPESCLCTAGHGGRDCGFCLETLYFSEKPWENLEMKPLELQGWNPRQGLYRQLLDRIQPNFIIEVGIWKGLSTSMLAGKVQNSITGLSMS